MTKGAPWLLNELQKMQQHACDIAEQKTREKPRNPRPPGVIQGDTTRQVLRFLESTSGWHTLGQIKAIVNGTHSGVTWALIRLKHWGLIESMNDGRRNPRYLRYRFIRKNPDTVDT